MILAAGLVANGVVRGTASGAFLYGDAVWVMALWAAAKLAIESTRAATRLRLMKVDVVLDSDEETAADSEQNTSMLTSKLILKLTAHWMGVDTLLRMSRLYAMASCIRIRFRRHDSYHFDERNNGAVAHNHRSPTTAIRVLLKPLTLQNL